MQVTTMKSKFKLLLALCATTILFAQFPAQAQNAPTSSTTNRPAQNQPESTAKKSSAGPFHGKLAAVDLASRSIKVGKRTFFATPETKIQKGGKPAKLEDGVVGETCSGYVRPDERGRLIAKSINFGPKPEAGATNLNPKPKDSKQPKGAQPQ